MKKYVQDDWNNIPYGKYIKVDDIKKFMEDKFDINESDNTAYNLNVEALEGLYKSFT